MDTRQAVYAQRLQQISEADRRRLREEGHRYWRNTYLAHERKKNAWTAFLVLVMALSVIVPIGMIMWATYGR